MTHIPIYRAKKIDGDEWVDGDLVRTSYEGIYINGIDLNEGYDFEIDQKTLSIHFPNMIDKNGKRIFASLSEDGVGGDLCINPSWQGKDNPCNLMVAIVKENVIGLMYVEDGDSPLLTFNKAEVIGIHKGVKE